MWDQVAAVELVTLRDADGVVVIGVGKRTDFFAPFHRLVLDHCLNVLGLGFLLGRQVLLPPVVLVLLRDFLVLLLL